MRDIIKRLVAFAVLMEGGEGILVKHPDYVLEKWHLVQDSPVDLLPQLMDQGNRAKYKRYLEEWA